MTDAIHSLPATSTASERIPFWQDEHRQAGVALVLIVMVLALMTLSRCAENRREAERQAAGINISEMIQEAR